MSKNKKKYHKQRKNILWPFIVLGGGLLVLAAILFANQDGGGTPSIAVDQPRIDYGDVNFNTEKAFAIKVTNTGDGILRLKEEPYIEVLEGC